MHGCVGERLCGAWSVGEGCRFSFSSFFAFFQKKVKKFLKYAFQNSRQSFLLFLVSF